MASDVLHVKESDLKEGCYRLNHSLDILSDSVTQVRADVPGSPITLFASKDPAITFHVPTPNYGDAGVGITLTRVGMWVFHCIWEFVCIGAGDVGQTFQGNLNLDGTRQGITASYVPRNVGDIGNVKQQYFLPCTKVGAFAKLQAVKSGGGGTSVADFNTSMIAQWVSF